MQREQEPAKGIVVDIAAELAYWQRIWPTTEFGGTSLPFDSFVPSIKFGYDCYLLFYKQGLADTLPGLRDRYQRTVPVDDQLDWRWADQIIRHTWGRLLAG
jgi:hypothetical protein